MNESSEKSEHHLPADFGIGDINLSFSGILADEIYRHCMKRKNNGEPDFDEQVFMSEVSRHVRNEVDCKLKQFLMVNFDCNGRLIKRFRRDNAPEPMRYMDGV